MFGHDLGDVSKGWKAYVMAMEDALSRQRPLEAFPGEWEWEELTQTLAPAQVVQVYGKGFQGRMTGLVD